MYTVLASPPAPLLLCGSMLLMPILYSFFVVRSRERARKGWQSGATQESGRVQEHVQVTHDGDLPARSSNRRFKDLQFVSQVGISVDATAQVAASAQFAATNSSPCSLPP